MQDDSASRFDHLLQFLGVGFLSIERQGTQTEDGGESVLLHYITFYAPPENGTGENFTSKRR